MEFRSNLYSKILFCIIPTLFHSLTYAKDVQKVKIKSENTHEAVQSVSKQSRNSHQVYQAILVPVSAVLIIGVFLIVRSFTKADVEDNGNVQELHDNSSSEILNKPISKEKNNDKHSNRVGLLSMNNNHNSSDNKLPPPPSQVTPKGSLPKVVQKNVSHTHSSSFSKNAFNEVLNNSTSKEKNNDNNSSVDLLSMKNKTSNHDGSDNKPSPPPSQSIQTGSLLPKVTQNSSIPSTNPSKRDQSNSLKLGKHKSFDALNIKYRRHGGYTIKDYTINKDNVFYAIKSCLISEESFWKPFQEKQIIWGIPQRASNSVLKADLKKLIDHLRKRAPDQSIHMNIGGHGNEDGHITYDELADIKLTPEDEAAIESKKNISLHRMSKESDAIYPKEANHVIDAWDFSLQTRKKKHCQAFKEYSSRREDFFKLHCIKRAFLKGSNIEVPPELEGLIQKFTGHPLNSITQKSEQAILDEVTPGSDEYKLVTSLGGWHSRSRIEKELETRYCYQRDNNQLNNPNYYTQRIKDGLFDELLEKRHLDSCRLLLGHPSIFLTKKGGDFKPDQMIQNREKEELSKLSLPGLHIKFLCNTCKHESWYYMGKEKKIRVFRDGALYNFTCPRNDCEKKYFLEAKLMAFKKCQYDIVNFRCYDIVNFKYEYYLDNFSKCKTELIHDKGIADKTIVLKEIYKKVIYKDLVVKISDLSNSCQYE